MKNSTDAFIKKALKSLDDRAKPSQEQKQIMLENLLIQAQTGEASGFERLQKMVTVYPWRFGFGVSALQAVFVYAAVWLELYKFYFTVAGEVKNGDVFRGTQSTGRSV